MRDASFFIGFHLLAQAKTKEDLSKEKRAVKKSALFCRSFDAAIGKTKGHKTLVRRRGLEPPVFRFGI